MARPKFNFLELEDYTILKFEIPGGVTSPEEAAQAVKTIEGRLPGEKPLLVNGRGPVWLYGMLCHAGHPRPAVATYDPRLAGYVVVATHKEGLELGQVIPDPEL